MVMHETDWALLERYLARDCTPEERARTERWIAEVPERRRLIELMGVALDEPERVIGAERRSTMLAALRREMAARRRPAAVRPHPAFAAASRSRWGGAWRAAAAVLIVAGAALGGRAYLSGGGNAATADAAVRTLATPRGQRASFHLPDGTLVILGPGSTLRQTAGFGHASREVQLEGDAYFDVQHDVSRPFVVRAHGIVAQDLGTQFVVRADAENVQPAVIVRAGLVALRAATDTAPGQVIHPGQLGRLLVTGQAVVEPTDTSAAFAWTEGSLVFANIPLRDALPQLARWYDLDFRLTDTALGAIRLSATLRAQPTDEALALLARSLGLREARRGRVVTFSRALPSH